MAKLSPKAQRDLLADRVNVHNPYNFCSRFNPGAKVYIDYRAGNNGRAYVSAGWQVIGVGRKTDPGGLFLDHGHKTFYVYGRADSEGKRLSAVEWATAEGFGDGWAKDPFGAFQTADTIAAYETWLATEQALAAALRAGTRRSS